MKTIVVIYIMVAILGITGWVMNLTKLCQCDFEPSYRAEVIRLVGVFTGPVGSVMGFLDIPDYPEPNEK